MRRSRSSSTNVRKPKSSCRVCGSENTSASQRQPNETYALTGLKIKAGECPAEDDCDRTGPRRRRLHSSAEQHLSAATTPGRRSTAGLEVNAEPKITERRSRCWSRRAGRCGWIDGRRPETRTDGAGFETESLLRLAILAGPRAIRLVAERDRCLDRAARVVLPARSE